MPVTSPHASIPIDSHAGAAAGTTVSVACRQAAGALAALTWFGLALQLAVTVSMMTAAGDSVLAAIWRYLGYFTILANLLVACTLTAIARRRWPGGAVPDVSAIAGVVMVIFVVGVVYHLLLSKVVPPMGPVWWTADRIQHYVVPWLTVAWWLALAPKRGLGWADPWRWLVFPVGYLLYALGRGAGDGWYPYYFIDVATLGYRGALVNAVLLSLALLVVGYVVVGGVRATAGRRA